MGKSSKKSSTKVDAIMADVPPPGKKGKRSAESEIEKAASAKKQKLERDEVVEAKQKQKAEKKQQKKVASSSSEDDSDDTDSEPKAVSKKTPFPAKNVSVVGKESKMDTLDSSDDSESDSDDSDEKAVKNGSIGVKKTPPADSSKSSSDNESDDEKPTAALKNGASEVSSTSSDSESSDEELKNVAAQPKKALNKPAESSNTSSSSDSDSSDEEEKKVTAQPKKAEKKPAVSSDTSDSDDSSDEDNATKVTPVAASETKVESSDTDSDDSSDSDEKPKADNSKAIAKPAKAESSSSDESSDGESDESSDGKPAKAQPVKKVQVSNKSSSSDEDDSDDEENDKRSLQTPKKKDMDVEMVDAEKSAPTFQKTPKTPEATGSNTLFVGNLSFSVEESDVREFFKEAGKVVDVRFASNPDGSFKGYGHVEFATAEVAQKALELNGHELLGRKLRLDLAHARGSYTPKSRENNSFQKAERGQGQGQGQTIFVRGFDTSLGVYEIRSALQEHFRSCGEITRVSIPKDYETGSVKGSAYMDFADSKGFNAAFNLDGSELGTGFYLRVQEARPRDDSGGRFDKGGERSGGPRGPRDHGRGSVRGRRGSAPGRGDRDGKGRGRGASKPSVTSMASGKKITFGDD